MVMSRRKQRNPKSLKDEEIIYDLPDELEFDKQSIHIIARKNLKQNHSFGPFPVILQVRAYIFHLYILMRFFLEANVTEKE
ncbi:unnamed protein product [Rotaria sp. Silwood1]|nr:unnamed protein product [Rotaria sp. Silwood1]